MNPDLDQLIQSRHLDLPRVTIGSPDGSRDEYESHRVLCGLNGEMHRADPWMIGFLLDERERKWGERYTDAAEDFRLDEKTLRNYCWVYRNAGRSFRKDQPQLTGCQELVTTSPPRTSSRRRTPSVIASGKRSRASTS